MKTSQVHGILVLLGVVVGLCYPSAALQPDMRYRSFLQRAHTAAMGPQDWSRRVVEDLMSRLALPEDISPQSEMSTTDEGEEMRVELERSVDGNNLPPRERKAGCKNFYWKGFTSC